MKRKNKESIFVSIFKGLLIFVVILGLFGFAGYKIVETVKYSHLFEINEIVIDPSLAFIKSSKLAALEGKNIFEADLKGLQRQLQIQYPELSHLRLSKRFPDQILVSAKKRLAFAQSVIKGKDVTLDPDCVVLSVTQPITPEYPLIVGVSDLETPVPGVQMKSREAQAAVYLIRNFRTNKYLQTYKIQKVDVNNLSQIEFHLTDTLKIIVDQFDIEQKIQTLSLIISGAGLNLEEIDYIDLRFKEPLIRQKIADEPGAATPTPAPVPVD